LAALGASLLQPDTVMAAAIAAVSRVVFMAMAELNMVVFLTTGSTCEVDWAIDQA
jgi:hypothetical protein